MENHNHPRGNQRWMIPTFKSIVLLCSTLAFLFSGNIATAQCGPGEDTTTPIAKCKDINVAINSMGVGTVDPQDVDNGSSDNCGIDDMEIIISDFDNDQVLECEDVTAVPFTANSGTVDAMLVVMDAEGNSNTCNLTIVVEDTAPPTIDVAAIPNRNYDCDNLPVGYSFPNPSTTVTGDAEPGTTDNCGVMDVTYSDAVSGTEHCHTITRTWTATDIHGNESTHTQTITVQDDDGPTFTASFPADRTVRCDGAIADYSPGTPNNPPSPNPTIDPLPSDELDFFDYNDNCSDDADINISVVTRDTRYVFIGPTYTLVRDPSDCEFYSYIVTHTWTATDECNNSTTKTQTITVQDDTAPVFYGSDLPAAGTTINVPAINGCGATFPNAFADLDLRDNVSDICAPFNHISGSYTAANIVNPYAGSTLNANGTYPVGFYNFTFTAMDPCGNMRTHSFSINIIDNVAPTAKCHDEISVSVPPSGMVEIDAADADNGSVDNCSGVTLSLSPNMYDCDDIGTTTMATLTVTDGSGNSATCTTDIEIVDETGPSVMCTPITRSLDASGNYTLSQADLMALGAGSFDACDYGNGSNGIDWANSSVSPNTFSCSTLGFNAVTLTIADYAGNTTTIACSVTIQDTTDPSIFCQPYTAKLDASGNATIEPGWLIGGGYQLVITSGDNGSGTSGSNSYTATGSGSAATMVSFTYTYSTDDSNGSDDLPYYILNGTATPLSTSGGSVGPMTLSPGGTFGFRMNTNSNLGGRGKLIITSFSPGYTDEFAPHLWMRNATNSDGMANIVGSSLSDNCADYCTLINNLTVNPSTVDCDDAPSITATVSVHDGNGNDNDCTSTVTISDMVDPEPECKDFMAQLDEDTFNGSVAVEPGWLIDGERKLYMMSGSNASNSGVGITEYTVRVKTPTTISFTYDYQPTTPPGAIFRDQFGYVKNGVFTALETTGTANPSGAASVSVSTGDTFGFRTTTNDGTSGGAIYSGSAKVVVSFGGSTDFFVADFDPVQWERGYNNVAVSYSKYMFITYGGVFISGSDIGDACTDVCDIEMRINDDGSADMDNSTPAAFAYYNCDDTGNTYPATIEITDGSGNVGACMADLAIVDEVDPVINICPTTQTGILDANGEYDVENGLGAFIAAFSTDNCDVVDHTSAPAMLDCTHAGQTITVKTTVFDPSGNSTFCETQVTIQDNSEPEMLCPAPTSVNCGDSTDPADTGMATATDNCGAVTIEMLADVTSTCNSGSFTITRTWRATDTSGNTDECSQVITVTDNTDPVLSATPTNTSAECGAVPAAPAITANDACSGDLGTITPVQTDNQNGNPALCSYYNYTVTRTWTATDDCGNSAVHTQMITVADTKEPVADFPNNLTYSTDVNSCFATITDINFADYVTDCAADQYLTYSNIMVDGSPRTAANANGSYPPGTYTVTFDVDDPCGNGPNSVSFNFTVEDNQGPQVNTVDFTVTLSGTNPGSITPHDVDNGSTDNCAIDQLLLDVSTFDCDDLGQNTVVLTVIDIHGNTSTGNAIVTVEGNDCATFTLSTSSTNATFPDYDDGTATVTVSPSGSYSYMWTDSNGDPVGGNSASIGGLAPGTYTVKVTDTNTGEMQQANVVVGSDTAPGVRFIVGDVTGEAGTTINLPITVENFNSVVSFEYIVELTDANIAQVMGLTAVAPIDIADVTWSVDAGNNTIEISYASDGAVPQSTGDGNVILNIQIQLGPGVGMTPATISGLGGNPIEVSQNFGSGIVFSDGVGVDGSVTVTMNPTMFPISGTIRNDDGAGIENVTVNLVEQGTMNLIDTDMTDANGDYVVNSGVGDNVMVMPVSQNNSYMNDIDFWDNGVTTGDAAIIQGHSANIAALQITDTEELIAADVSNNATDGSCTPSPITSGDALIIQALVVGNISQFPNNESWRFVEASHVYSFPDCPWNPAFPNESTKLNNVSAATSNIDFVGIKIGDVGASRANPVLLTGSEEEEERSSGQINFVTDDISIAAGEQYQIPFHVEGFSNMISCQFTMEFDQNYLTFEEIVPGDLTNINTGNFGLNFIEEGYVNFGWFNADATNMDSRVPVFYLTFTAEADAENLSDLLQISSLYTKKEAMNIDLYDFDVELNFNTLTSTDDVEPTLFQLYPNRPNPFKEQTLISFDLVEKTDATLEIMDINGKILYTNNATFNRGYNEVLITTKDLPSGILYYRLRTDKQTVTAKMIKI